MKTARLAAMPEDYRRFGLTDRVEPWEDGHRTNGRLGEYEWWYFDGRMDDGSSLVIVYYTQPVTAIAPDYSPSVTFSLTKGARQIKDSVAAKKKDSAFSRDACAVKVGACTCEGDLSGYTLHYESGRITADVKLTSGAAPWRPETGHFLFDEKKYFAWLPSVPEGRMEAVIRIGGKRITLTGTGYHDHNWGNAGMFWLMHHWYWGRAKIGEYQVISSYITAHKPYGYEHFPIFLLSKNGKKLGDNPEFLTYTQSDSRYDPITKKHFFGDLCYDYNDGAQHYRITYHAERIIETFVAAESKTTVQARSNPLQLRLVKMAGLAPSYIRMVGTVTLERFDGGEVSERVDAPGLWEQMYFGRDEDV